MAGMDESAVERARQGDKGAFGELFQAYQKPIFGFLLRLTGSRELASDLTQEAFLKAFAALPRVQGPLRFGPWLYKIARNLSLDYFKKKKESLLDDSSSSLSERHSAMGGPLSGESGESPERALNLHDIRILVRKALLRLRPKERFCLLIRDVQGLSYEEASEVMGLSPAAFTSVLSRARARFRKSLLEVLFPRVAADLEAISDLGDIYSHFDPADPPADLCEAILLKVSTYFDSVARDWDKVRAVYFNESVREEALAEGLLSPGMVVADFGGGTGYITLGLAARCREVVLVDISRKMLDQAKRTLESRGVYNVRYVRGDVCDLRLEEGSVDAAFGCMILHHVLSPPSAIEEMARVLRPRGRLVLVDLYRHKNKWQQEELKDVWLGFTPSDMGRWLRRAGFQRVRIKPSAEVCNPGSGREDQPGVPIMIASGTKGGDLRG